MTLQTLPLSCWLWSWCFLHMPPKIACFLQSATAHNFFFAPCAMHFPPWTATFVHPSESQRLRAGPCVLQKPAFLTCLVQPGCLQIFLFAPWAIHSPPCTTRFSHPSIVHLRRTRLLVPPVANGAAVEADRFEAVPCSAATCGGAPTAVLKYCDRGGITPPGISPVWACKFLMNAASELSSVTSNEFRNETVEDVVLWCGPTDVPNDPFVEPRLRGCSVASPKMIGARAENDDIFRWCPAPPVIRTLASPMLPVGRCCPNGGRSAGNPGCTVRPPSPTLIAVTYVCTP
mmetsp:Transcript_9012/g.22745  ORF Transcript_9012/g.22745 Transcript_9012/m.22745 type:complete len:288 (+) Transcript_9012:2611-3474(+)